MSNLFYLIKFFNNTLNNYNIRSYRDINIIIQYMSLKVLFNNMKTRKEWHIISYEENIENLFKKLQKESTLDDFISELLKKYSISNKIKNNMTTIILLSRFPNELLSTNLCDKETELWNRAVEIHTIIKNTTIKDFNILAKKICTFNILYDDWKSKDLHLQKDLLCELFYSYKNFYHEIDNQNLEKDVENMYKNNINDFLNKILNTLKGLNKNWKRDLKHYTFKNIEYDVQSHKHMLKYLKLVFWDNIKLEVVIKNNFKVLNFLINDYLAIIKNIISIEDKDLLENYPNINNIESAINLCNSLQIINKKIDNLYDYTNDINENNLINTLIIIFERLEYMCSILQ